MRCALWLAALLLLAGSASGEEPVVRLKFRPAGAKTPERFRLVTESDQYAPGKPGWLKTGHLNSAERPNGSLLARSFVYGNTPREGGAANPRAWEALSRMRLSSGDSSVARRTPPQSAD